MALEEEEHEREVERIRATAGSPVAAPPEHTEHAQEGPPGYDEATR